MKLDLEIARRRLDDVCVASTCSIREAIVTMDRAGLGVVLIREPNNSLGGVVTDGDVRRAILREIDFCRPCIQIATAEPLVAITPITCEVALDIMNRGRGFVVNHLPFVDEDMRLQGLLLRRDLSETPGTGASAVIMAGGLGRRLLPLTRHVPKPMLPLAGQPLIRRTIDRLRQAGIVQVVITTHYRHEAIAHSLGDGRSLGVSIDYVREDEPLGTAGSLRHMSNATAPILVINGDVLTDVNFKYMLQFHHEHNADMTIATRRHHANIPYGVVELDGARITAIVEKPAILRFINAGIYLLNPSVCSHIPSGVPYDLPELVHSVISAGGTVVGFPLHEYWIDIGRPADYRKAQSDFLAGIVA